MTSNTFISVAEALQRIRGALQPISGIERRHLRDAWQRVLAEPVSSPLNVPGYVNSAMDGYAINSASLRQDQALTVIGQALAGVPFDGQLQPGQALRIMTGAMLPEGADTVIMQEDVQREGDQIRIQGQHQAGANVRQIGEDIAAGAVVLAAGKILGAAELGLLASLGIAEVSVRRRLRVASFSTGDELCSIGQPLQAGQIYDSNRYALYGLLREMGVEHIDMGVIRDDRQAIRQAFQDAASIADVVITSGGVSVGDADFVKQTIDELGQVDFWKIRMKPGKPLAFGRLGDAVFFGLPGNPVSSMATFYQIVLPSLRHLQGQAWQAPLGLLVRCSTALKKSPGRADYQRGILEMDAQGELSVRSTGHQGSHILSSMSQANCFIVLPDEAGNTAADETVMVQPFPLL
ncbi:MAG: molybdopterin molybdotransferase MoeA [Thiohalomonadaceae bacterium]